MAHIISKLEGVKELNKALEEYAKFTSRTPAEVCNAKAYFISLRAMNTTKKADKQTILDKLRAASKKYPDVPLEAVLVNLAQRRAGKKGLTGAAMEKAIERFERRSVSRLQFLRSGWLAGVKDLDSARRLGDIQFVKANMNGLKRPQGIKQFGAKKGSVIPARADRPVTFCQVTNSAGTQGKQNNENSKATEILEKGLQEAFKKETQSINEYIQKKLQQGIDKLNRTQTV